MTDEQARKLWSQAIGYAISRKLFHEAEDFAVTVVIAAVEDGRYSTSLQWAWADYNRIKWGDRKTMKGRAKEAAIASMIRLDPSGRWRDEELAKGYEKWESPEIKDERASQTIDELEERSIKCEEYIGYYRDF